MADFFQYDCPLCADGTASIFSSTPGSSILFRDLSAKILEMVDTQLEATPGREPWAINPRPRCFRGLFLDGLEIDVISKLVYSTQLQ